MFLNLIYFGGPTTMTSGRVYTLIVFHHNRNTKNESFTFYRGGVNIIFGGNEVA